MEKNLCVSCLCYNPTKLVTRVQGWPKHPFQSQLSRENVPHNFFRHSTCIMTKSQIFVSFINLQDKTPGWIFKCPLWVVARFLFSFYPVEFDGNVLKILVSSFPWDRFSFYIMRIDQVSSRTGWCEIFYHQLWIINLYY